MTANEIRDALKRKPFEPRRIIVADGSYHDLKHPDLYMIGVKSIRIGLTDEPELPIFKQTVSIDLRKISRIISVKDAYFALDFTLLC